MAGMARGTKRSTKNRAGRDASTRADLRAGKARSAKPRGKPARAHPASERPPAEAPRRSRPQAEPEPSALPPPQRREGALPVMRAPVILATPPSDDYALLDSGEGSKLERCGPVTVVRPEAQAIWPRRLPPHEWARADAAFTGAGEDDDSETRGRWAFSGAFRDAPTEVWPTAHDGIAYHGRFTAFRHIGVFPEQAAHWRWMEGRLAERSGIGGSGSRTPSVLNLFGYTGLASLVAARAGAEVTHVDASKKAVGWARENADMAGLADAPIRWIVDDAAKFVAREGRRGRTYDLILLDPPKFGRGPNGEVWQLFEHVAALLSACRDILSARPVGVVLTAYAVRASFYALHGLMGEAMRGLGGTVESGELVIEEAGEDARALPTSLFSRWVAE